jgi:hypothetical protein
MGRNLAFVSDLDGTLVDSVYQHVLAWQEALDGAGILDVPWAIATSGYRETAGPVLELLALPSKAPVIRRRDVVPCEITIRSSHRLSCMWRNGPTKMRVKRCP